MGKKERKDPRAKVLSMTVRYRSATLGEFIEHHSYDVSRSGMFIKTPSPFPAGTLLKFQVGIADEQRLLTGVGRVVWIREKAGTSSDEPCGMGIKFIKIDEGSRALLEQLVASQGADSSNAFERNLKKGQGEAKGEGRVPAEALKLKDDTVLKPAAELLEEALRKTEAQSTDQNPEVVAEEKAAESSEQAELEALTQVEERQALGAVVERQPIAEDSSPTATLVSAHLRSQDKQGVSGGIAALLLVAAVCGGGFFLWSPQSDSNDTISEADEKAKTKSQVESRSASSQPSSGKMPPAALKPKENPESEGSTQAETSSTSAANEPASPSEPSAESPSVAPSEPTAPSAPAAPSEPTSPSAPAAPSEPAAPSAPSEPTEPTAPSKPAEPTEPTSPSAPAAPSEPAAPSAPAAPSEPAAPSAPAAPSEPAAPSAPAAPSEPAAPSAPAAPSEPAAPSAPAAPSEPAAPSAPSAPPAQ